MADSDLAEIRKKCITSLYLCTDNVSKYLDDEKEAEFDKLKSYVENYCLLEAEQHVAVMALERIKGETNPSNVDTLQDRFTEYLSSMADRHVNNTNHPYVTEFNKRIKNQLQPRQNLDDSELTITESQDVYIDPITKKQMLDPVKNTICGHAYERQAIMDLIKRKTSTKCPVAGCGNKTPIQAAHLITDEELKFRLTITQHSTMIQ